MPWGLCGSGDLCRSVDFGELKEFGGEPTNCFLGNSSVVASEVCEGDDG